MQNLMQVLGADIPHHNLTLLAFFQQLAEQKKIAVPCNFMVVAQQPINCTNYPDLVIQQFSSQKSLAKVVIRLAKNPQQHFFLHGQFNTWIWLALLSQRLSGSRVYWHIWGGDLYETARGMRYHCFYFLRRLAQGKFKEVFATEGDATEYRQRYPNNKVSRLYFPARPVEVPAVIPTKPIVKSQLTILLGNSGDASNRHIEALARIRQQFGQNIKLIIPMGYPQHNESYIAQVERQAQAIFPAKQVKLLRNKLDFTEYQQVIAGCDLGYFPFERQQGIGTLCIFIMHNIPLVLNRKNRFWQDLVSAQLPVLFDTDSITSTMLEETQRQLQQCDKTKISFIYPEYEMRWIEILRRLNAEAAA